MPENTKRGRPSTGQALTNAQRQARHREMTKQAAMAKMENIAGAFANDSDDHVLTLLQTGGTRIQEMAWREFGRRKGWI